MNSMKLNHSMLSTTQSFELLLMNSIKFQQYTLITLITGIAANVILELRWYALRRVYSSQNPLINFIKFKYYALNRA
jgi:hypothetical protein